MNRPSVNGTIDRLAETDGGVLLVDYKTNRPPPRTLAEVPPPYILQIALYRTLLQPLHAEQLVSERSFGVGRAAARQPLGWLDHEDSRP